MKKIYNHRLIEQKWNEIWAKNKPVDVTIDKKIDKYYCLDMFPYPSGSGLHVGHWRGYVMSDFYTRHAQLHGKTVLHPMGYDAFGLPAENAAIKEKSHPRKFTEQAITNFSKQLQQIGASFDWTKEINTSSPEYYRWTQWLFLQLYKKGYAEKRKSLVNWCPKDQTVLANEQVVDGCCERCGTKVTKKELEQWYFLTTKLAGELLAGLDNVDWPERVKHLQRNWIGKSEGANVKFPVKDSKNGIDVFTTRPDTLFGVTAVVLAPEHPLSAELAQKGGKTKEFNQYYKEVSAKTNVDRAQGKESQKTALYLGINAIHPLTNKEIPIWTADYVLMEYGTGAVMSVPAHDERDFIFAKTHHLPIKQVISFEAKLPYSGHGTLIDSGNYSGQPSVEAAERIVADLESADQGKFATTYRLRDWLVSRQRYWGAPIPIVYDPEGRAHPISSERLPVLLPDDVDFTPGGESPLARSVDFQNRAEKLYGKGWRYDTDTLDTFVDSSWYFLRYLTPQDDKNAFDRNLVAKWLPVDLYIGGIEHATLHLLYARFIYRFLEVEGYLKSTGGEPFKKLFNIGMITLRGAKMSKSKGNVVSPDPLIEHYGTDALRGYELFVGPMDLDAEWNPRGINGIHRFLIKLANIAPTAADNAATRAKFDLYLTKINDQIRNYRLNTFLSSAMEFTNEMAKSGIDQETFGKFLTTLSPVFPYLCEELWQKLGHDSSIFQASWPIVESTNKQAVDVWKLLKNQKFIKNLEVSTGEEPSDELILAELKNLGINSRKYYVNKAGKVVNIVVS